MDTITAPLIRDLSNPVAFSARRFSPEGDGYVDVVDADLSKYFDTIPHSELIKSVARRVVDRNVLRLIKM
jgi:hypothetical protein